MNKKNTISALSSQLLIIITLVFKIQKMKKWMKSNSGIKICHRGLREHLSFILWLSLMDKERINKPLKLNMKSNAINVYIIMFYF